MHFFRQSTLIFVLGMVLSVLAMESANADYRALVRYRTGLSVNDEPEVLSLTEMRNSSDPAVRQIYQTLQRAPDAAAVSTNDFETFNYPCTGRGENRTCDFTATPTSTGHICDGTNRQTLARLFMCLERRFSHYSSEASVMQTTLSGLVESYNNQAQAADRFNLSVFMNAINIRTDGWGERGDALLVQMQTRCRGNDACLAIYNQINNAWQGLKNKLNVTIRVQRMRSALYEAHHLPWSEESSEASLFTEYVYVEPRVEATEGEGTGNGGDGTGSDGAGSGESNPVPNASTGTAGTSGASGPTGTSSSGVPGVEHLASFRRPTDPPPPTRTGSGGTRELDLPEGNSTEGIPGPRASGDGEAGLGVGDSFFSTGPIPVDDCEFLTRDPLARCRRGSVFEGPPAEELNPLIQSLEETSRPLLLDQVASYMARHIAAGYMQHHVLTPGKTIQGLRRARTHLAAQCSGNPTLRDAINDGAKAVIDGVQDSFTEGACRNREFPRGATNVDDHLSCVRGHRHDIMIADAEELSRLTHILASLKADFPSGDMTPVSSAWPTWLPGSQTIARFMDMYAVGTMGLAENRQRPCGFLQAGEIGQLMNPNEIHNPSSCPINRETGRPDCALTSSADAYLVEMGVVTSERPGTAAERCEAKRILMRQYGRSLADIVRRSPHLAAQVTLSGSDDEVPVFEAVANATSLRVKRQIIQEAYSLDENQSSALNPTEEYIADLCSDTRDVARDLFTNTDLLRGFLSCDGIAPLPVSLQEDTTTTTALDGSPLSADCRERRQYAALSCVIRAEATNREAGINAGLTMMGMGFDALGIVGIAAGGAGLMSGGIRAGVSTAIRSLLNPGTIGRSLVGAGIGAAIGYPLYRRSLAEAQATSACFYAGDCSYESYRDSQRALRDAENGLIRDALIGIILDRAIDVHPRAAAGVTPDVDVDGVRTARPVSPESAFGELRPGDRIRWRGPSGVEQIVTFESFDPETGLLNYHTADGPTGIFIEDLLDDIGDGDLHFIRSGVDGAVNFDMPVASYPRFQQMLSRLRSQFGAEVLHGAEGQAAIAEMMRRRGITNPSDFPTGVFLPGRAPDVPPRILLAEGANLDTFMHEIRHLSQWREALEGRGGAIGEVARRARALPIDSPVRPTMQALSFYLDEVDASIYNRHMNALTGNVDGVAHYTRMIDDEIRQARELADSLPAGRERDAALDAVAALETRRDQSITSLPENMRPGAGGSRAPPVVVPEGSAPVTSAATLTGAPSATVWDRMTPTGESPSDFDPIPASFIFEGTPSRVWVHPNALRHLREEMVRDVGRERPLAAPETADPTILTGTNRTPPPAIVHRPAMMRLAGQILVADLEGAVTTVMDTPAFRDELTALTARMRDNAEPVTAATRPRIFGVVRTGNGTFYEIGISSNPNARPGEATFVLYHAREVPDPGGASPPPLRVFQGERSPNP